MMTTNEMIAAHAAGQELAAKSLARELPFLGMYGAEDASGFTNVAQRRMAGMAYLNMIHDATGSGVNCDPAGFIVL